MFGKVRKILGWTFTIAYGTYLVVTTIRETKELVEEIDAFKKIRKATRSANGWKPEGSVIETTFVDQ